MRIVFEKLLLLTLAFLSFHVHAQIYINEGSNKNYSALQDEDGEFPDWIELYNAGQEAVSLQGYSLTDDPDAPSKWIFPNDSLMPGGYLVVFCSGKDRKPVSKLIHVLSEVNYNPGTGWNTHTLSTPFYWDGVSSIMLNTCSYSSTGYTSNSIFNQSATPYYSTLFAVQDYGPDICSAQYGSRIAVRPNIKFNNTTIGDGAIENSPVDYPAPYGNWYWAARNQMIFPASELLAQGLTPGDITEISFDVVSTDPNTVYDYIDFSMKLLEYQEFSGRFEPADTSRWLHTNFKIAGDGETVYLYSPAQQLLSSLEVRGEQPDNSVGSLPDGTSTISYFNTGTPGATNNDATQQTSYLLPPVLSQPSGFYNTVIEVQITDPNPPGTLIRYTLNGDDPDSDAAAYTGAPIPVFYSQVLKAKAFSSTELPSATSVASYLLGIDHVTPILSVVTDPQNLYGETGIFDHAQFDWEKAAYVEYFDTARQLIFSQRAGIQIDGGAGGSRFQPQHSFRVELDHPVLGAAPIDYPLIPNRAERTRYSRFYLRNGSNYYLTMPHKDAAHVEGMAATTYNYYSAWRPVTVYLNGAYFGLYELREKFDSEYFEELDQADPDSLDILSLSFWNGSVLRPVVGSVDSFYTAYEAFQNLNPASNTFWDQADRYFDMKYYQDYIIGETWAGNIDWPGNNIKIYRSNATDFRWRFCLIDLEGSMNPDGFSTAHDDHIAYVLGASPDNPFINIFLKGVQNARFKNSFINRYADLMNTEYQYSRLSDIENSMFNQTVVEMPNEYMRWGDPNNIGGQMNDFYNNHLIFQSELAVRTGLVRDQIQQNFALDSQVEVTLDVFPPGAGKIKISTIIPENLPWTGVYFQGNPVRITAIPNPGFEFAFWEANAIFPDHDTNISVIHDIPSNTVYKAIFKAAESEGLLAFSEINYNSDSTRNAGDWIEFHNYGDAPVDLSGWRFTDSTVTNDYFFPSGTILQPGTYLVLADDPDMFHSQFPSISVYGPTGFGFSNANEPLTLLNTDDYPVVSVHYQDVSPWPAGADGYGRTLELLNNTLNPALPASWFAGCIGGSPGGPFVPCTEQIVFSEINYKSAATADAGDWVELWNIAAVPADLSGWYFQDSDNAHNFQIPANTVLSPSERLVLAGDDVLFHNRFPGVGNYSGPFGFGLGSTGDAVRLYDASGKLYQSVVYNNAQPWPQGANGNGYTLELEDENGHLNDGNNWKDGCLGGSPGTAPVSPCAVTGVRDEPAGAGQMRIFPNPSSGVFNIRFERLSDLPAAVDAEVYTSIGQQVYSRTFDRPDQGMTLDLTGYPKGVYWVRVKAGNQFMYEILVLD
ncbi:MAG TPA: lamin tail domain-containing protein [Saprospiraceae bacterium]|nr:lamin tail domain-containing protein [Saprospiraceae bacterium]